MASKEKYLGIQVLRFVAAAMVLLTHSTFYTNQRNDPSTPVWHLGEAGVNIFFVISGFVIVLASKRESGWIGAGDFLYRRFARIIPMYWTVTTVNLAVLILFPQLVLHSTLDWMSILKSFLLIPEYNADGRVEPLVGVAWTLYFESFFYVAFASTLALKLSPMVFVPALMVVISLFSLSRSPEWPAVLIYVQPIVLEFAIGMCIAHWVARMKPNCFWGLFILLIGFFLLIFLDSLDLSIPSIILRGIPSALIVSGVVLLDPFLKLRSNNAFVFLGAASYTLYLVHPITAPIAPVLLTQFGIVNGLISIIMACVIALIASVVIYIFVENPLNSLGSGPIKLLARAASH